MSHYAGYIRDLCPKIESWQLAVICSMLDSKDEQIAQEKRNTEVEKIGSRALIAMLENIKQENLDSSATI